MSDGKKIDWHQAKKLADKVVRIFAPACERIEIAGSVRRLKSYVGDIEIVCIPKMTPSGLFGDQADNALLPVLERLCMNRGDILPVKGGDKYRQYQLLPAEAHGIMLDVFMVTAESWGVQLCIRTGPQEFSQKAVTPRCKAGLLQDGLKVEGGCLWQVTGEHYGNDGCGPSATRIDTREERDFMRYLSCGFLEPDQRAKIVGA